MIVPNEAQNAQKKLSRSDNALEIIERMRASQWVTLCGSDTAAAVKEWHDVAKQYQSAIELKESCVYCYTKLLQIFVDDPRFRCS